MKSLYEPPWNLGHSYDPDMLAERKPCLAKACGRILAIVVGTFLLVLLVRQL